MGEMTFVSFYLGIADFLDQRLTLVAVALGTVFTEKIIDVP